MYEIGGYHGNKHTLTHRTTTVPSHMHVLYEGSLLCTICNVLFLLIQWVDLGCVGVHVHCSLQYGIYGDQPPLA